MNRSMRFVLIVIFLLGMVLSSSAWAEIPPGWTQVGKDGLVDGTVVPGSPYSEKPSRNNSYAWSMGTLQCDGDEYLYVGAYRNFPHGAFLGPMSPLGTAMDPSIFGDSLPPSETWDPGTVEIMRKNITQNGEWEVVPLTPFTGVGDFSGNQGFRKMYNYEGVLYAGTMNLKMSSQDWDGVPKIIAISDCDSAPVDVSPEVVSGDLEENKAYSYRGMVEYDGQFVVAYEYGVYSTSDPLSGWERFSNDGFEGKGYVTDLVSYQGSLWAVTGDGENGWRLLRWVPEPVCEEEDLGPCVNSEGESFIQGSWVDETPGLKQSIHVGANGFVYGDHLYIATLNGGFPLYDLDILNAGEEELLTRMLKCIVPSYLYRFDGDSWETVMGSGTGLKAPGFGVPTNVYLWTWGIHEGDLYISTFDWRSFLHSIDWDSIELMPENQNVAVDVLKNLVTVHVRALCEMAGLTLPVSPSLSEIVDVFLNHGSPVGFDLYKSEDGLNFEVVMQDGFGDPLQYGGRTMVTTREDGEDILWLGTSNPGNGCQVWRYEEEPFPTSTEGVYPAPDGIFYEVKVTPCSEENNGEVSGDIREPSMNIEPLLSEVPEDGESLFFQLDLVNSDDICAVEICGYLDEADYEWLPDNKPNLWWYSGSGWTEIQVNWTDLGEGQWKACADLPSESWGEVFGALLDDSILAGSEVPEPGEIEDGHGGGSSGCNVGPSGALILLMMPLMFIMFRKL